VYFGIGFFGESRPKELARLQFTELVESIQYVLKRVKPLPVGGECL
jgi:hypothetical protein